MSTTYSDIKRRITKGTVLEVVSSKALPAGLRRTIIRTTSKGAYFTWTTPFNDGTHSNMPLATWGTAASVRVNEDGTWTRNADTIAETTWRIVDV